MKKRFQILALDGGGIKGLYTAALMANLEESLNTNIIDHFDLITGTSTGGLIALALSVGKKPIEIVELYFSLGQKVFKRKLPRRLLPHMFICKHESLVLVKALQDCFEGKILNDCSKRVVIPAYNLTNNSIYLFKTRHHDSLNNDYKVPIWKVARATSAAPTFFSAFKDNGFPVLVDGGVWANNPSMVGIVEASYLLNIGIHDIKLLNIGTTTDFREWQKYLHKSGWLLWAQKVPKLIMDAQSSGMNGLSKQLISPENFERFDAIVPDGKFKLDKINAEEILAHAHNDAREYQNIFKQKFMDHIADEFTPEPTCNTPEK